CDCGLRSSCVLCFLSLFALLSFSSFFFSATATTEPYTLSLHDALPIWSGAPRSRRTARWPRARCVRPHPRRPGPSRSASGPGRSDRKSTRQNSSHVSISYAVFCLKKKKHHVTQFHIVYITHLFNEDHMK